MTKRQAILLDRLVVFCERCGSPDLPLAVVRVLGYGSFFRGKERPGDIDLAVVTGGKHPLFDRFTEIVRNDLGDYRPDLALAGRMKALAASHPDPAVADAADLFAGWLEGMTDNMLYGQQTILGNLLKYSPAFFVDRMLHASLPGIRAKLTNHEESHVAQVVHEVWTPPTTDVRAVIGRIWERDQRDDLLTEALWFEEQTKPYLLQIAVLNRIADRLIQGRIRAVADKPEKVWAVYDAWLKKTDLGFSGELCVKATDSILGEYGSDVLPDPPGYASPDFESLDDERLANVVEEKRQSLIPLRERTVVLRLVTNHLAFWVFCEKKNTRLDKGRYVAKMVTEGIHAKQIKPRVVLEIVTAELRRLGLLVPGEEG